MYPNSENLHKEDSPKDETSLLFQYCAYYGFSALAVMIALLSATSSGANYLISTTKSTYEIGDEINSRFKDPDSTTPPYIEYAVGGFLGVLILACVSSILYQRFSKNYPKVRTNTTKCIDLPVNEETTALNAGSQRRFDENISISLIEQLNYLPIPKKRANLLIRLSEYPAFFSELILGAGSAATLVDTFLKIFTGDNVLIRQVFDAIGALLVGGSNGYVFKTVMSYQREQYDCHDLVKQHIREKYKHRSTLFQETLIQTFNVIRHLMIDSALFFGELGDYTSFEVIATMLFGELTTPIRAVGFLMCLSIAMTKWIPNHDKFDGVLFSALKGSVYKDEHVQDKDGCINMVTYPLSIIGTGYKNLMNTTYQVFKTTGNIYFGLFSGVASCFLGAANTAFMLHDLDKVDMEQLKREQSITPTQTTVAVEPRLIEQRVLHIQETVSSVQRFVNSEIESVEKKIEDIEKDVKTVKERFSHYPLEDQDSEDSEGIFPMDGVSEGSENSNQKRQRSRSGNAMKSPILQFGHFSHAIINISINQPSINSGERPQSSDVEDLSNKITFSRLSTPQERQLTNI